MGKQWQLYTVLELSIKYKVSVASIKKLSEDINILITGNVQGNIVYFVLSINLEALENELNRKD